MLLQNAVTCAQPQAAFGIDRRSWLSAGRCGGRDRCGRNSKYRRVPLPFGAEGQNSGTAVAERVQAVRDELQADLKQLIGIPQNFRQCGIELRAHFDLERLPLRLHQLNGRTRQGIEIDGTLGCLRLPGKADQTGDQRLRTANILPDLCRKWPLLLRERRAEQHVGITEHGGDWIVEFVGRAPAN